MNSKRKTLGRGLAQPGRPRSESLRSPPGSPPDAARSGQDPLSHYLRLLRTRGHARYAGIPVRQEPEPQSIEVMDPDDATILSLMSKEGAEWSTVLPSQTGKPERILVIDWKPPTPDKDSGSYRMSKILAAYL